MIEIKLNEKIISRSENLRGLIRYPRKITKVYVLEIEDKQALLYVDWDNKAKCVVKFASFSLCVQWCLRSRKIDNSIISHSGF